MFVWLKESVLLQEIKVIFLMFFSSTGDQAFDEDSNDLFLLLVDRLLILFFPSPYLCS